MGRRMYALVVGLRLAVAYWLLSRGEGMIHGVVVSLVARGDREPALRFLLHHHITTAHKHVEAHNRICGIALGASGVVTRLHEGGVVETDLSGTAAAKSLPQPFPGMVSLDQSKRTH